MSDPKNPLADRDFWMSVRDALLAQIRGLQAQVNAIEKRWRFAKGISEVKDQGIDKGAADDVDSR